MLSPPAALALTAGGRDCAEANASACLSFSDIMGGTTTSSRLGCVACKFGTESLKSSVWPLYVMISGLATNASICGISARVRLRLQQMTAKAIRIIRARPPITPPATGPAIDLCLSDPKEIGGGVNEGILMLGAA